MLTPSTGITIAMSHSQFMGSSGWERDVFQGNYGICRAAAIALVVSLIKKKLCCVKG